MKKIKNKKVILVLVLLLGIAASFAYYTTTDSFENIFKTSKYGTKVEEVFESPDDWTPGDETSKTVIATNTGDVCENVRVSYTESWKSENNNDLPLVDPTLNEKIAIINFDNTADWKQNGNYYYYNKNLLKNESTTSFIKSVTYNPNYATSGMNCTSTTEGNKTTKECSTGNDSYAGATYKLTITVETIQCDAMESEWGVKIEDLQPKSYTIVSGDLDTVGSIVKIADEEFYVIGKEGNNTKLLAKWNLKVGGVYSDTTLQSTYTSTEPGYGLQDENMKGIEYVNGTSQTMRYGTVAFSSTNYWSEDGLTYRVIVYDDNRNDVIKPIVDNYVSYLNDQGVTVSGRLISEEEFVPLGCVNIYGGIYCKDREGVTAPEWVYQTTYWSGTAFANNWLIVMYSTGRTGSGQPSDSSYSGVRPVIILEP